MHASAGKISLSAVLVSTMMFASSTSAQAHSQNLASGPHASLTQQPQSLASSVTAQSNKIPSVEQIALSSDGGGPYRFYDSRLNAQEAKKAYTWDYPVISREGIFEAFETRHIKSKYVRTIMPQYRICVYNVTAVSPESDGFITIWGTGNKPATSSLNFRKGQVIANQVHVREDRTSFKIYSHAKTHIVVDRVSCYTDEDRFKAAPPRRVHDSRVLGSNKPVGRTTTIRGLPSGVDPRTVEAIVANVTIVGKGVPGFVTAWRAGTRPTTSSLNYVGDALVSNQIVSKVAADGTFKVYTHSDAEVIVDVYGYIPKGQGIRAHQPIRLLDERQSGNYCCHKIKSDLIRIQVEQRPDSPEWNKHAVLLNVTVVGSTKPGFVSARETWYSKFTDRPRPARSSTQNYRAGTIRAGMAMVPVSDQGVVEIYRRGDAKVVVDMVGYVQSRTETVLQDFVYSDLQSVARPTSSISENGKLNVSLPPGYSLNTVWADPEELATQREEDDQEDVSIPLTEGVHYSRSGNTLMVNGKYAHGWANMRHLYVRMKADPQHPVARLRNQEVLFIVPVTVSGTSGTSANVALDGGSARVAAYSVAGTPGHRYEVKLADGQKFGSVPLVPADSAYSRVPSEVLQIRLSADRTSVFVNLPSRQQMRQYFGDYGAMPHFLTLRGKNAYGDRLEVFLEDRPYDTHPVRY